jgi:alpha-beta hydrolase superfamily lysophospholipase
MTETRRVVDADPDGRAAPPDGRVATIEAADGYAVGYRVWTPEERVARATLVLFNGVMSHSLWFRPLAGPLLAAGFKLVGADRRGTGMSAQARGDAPSAQVLLDDARAIIEHERLPDRPVHLVGWCWGAVLAINVAAAMRETLTSLILLAPGLFPTDELTRRMAAQEGVARESPEERPCLESPIVEEMFTSGPALDDFIKKDPQRLSRFSPRFLKIMGKLGMGARLKLPRLDLPLLVVLARDDLATDNPETVRGFGKLTGGRAKIETLDGAHGLQFDAPDALARTITDWAAPR